LNLNYFKRN